MADATKATARPSVTWPIPRLPAVCEKNIFHLIRYTQPVENYPYIHAGMQIWIWYWLRQELMVSFFKIIIFYLKQSWVVCLTWLELIRKQSVIHSFHQTKSESIKWENYWMLEVISLLVSHVCTSVGSQSNSQTVSQSFNHSIIHSIKGGLILVTNFMYSRWGTRMILQYAKEKCFPLSDCL